jgi:O-antigen/teichoic acid export membrane protein
MGVVRKQSILSSIFTYFGFAIGAVNILILFPKYFSTEQIGLTRTLLDVALLFATVCTLGSIPVTIKFFPFYQSYLPRKKNDLPFLSLMLGVTGSVLLLVLLPWLKPLIIRKFGARSPLFVTYFDLLYPFTITLVFFMILEAYAWSLKRTVLSNALKEFAFRLITTILIGLFIFGLLDFNQFITGYAYVYLLPVLVFVFYFFYRKLLPIHPVISPVTRRLKNKMILFGGFIFGGSLLNIIARTNDTIILASQSQNGLSDAAVFTIATYLVTVMEVPQRSLVAITTPFIAEAWKSRDLGRIDNLYKKTALNLLIAGMGIFGLVLVNLDDATRFMGKEYAALSAIVLISGVAKLIDLATGLNTQILLLSKYWKLDFFTNIFLVSLSIPLNYWLTKQYNVMGPAYGNLIAITLFNGLRFVLIYRLFKLQPFTWNNGKTLVAGLVCLGLTSLVPDLEHIFLNVLVHSLTFIMLFVSAVLGFRLSDDITGLVSVIRSRFGW